MVDPKIFGPGLLSAEQRQALRDKYTYGNGKAAFLMVYAGRISSEKGLDFCVQLLAKVLPSRQCPVAALPVLDRHSLQLPAARPTAMWSHCHVGLTCCSARPIAHCALRAGR